MDRQIAKLGCPFRKSYPRVTMMQSAQDRHGCDSPKSLGGPWSVLAQSQMSARLVVVNRIHGQNSPQMPFAKDQPMIETVAPQCADQALYISVLPGRPRRYPEFPMDLSRSLKGKGRFWWEKSRSRSGNEERDHKRIGVYCTLG